MKKGMLIFICILLLSVLCLNTISAQKIKPDLQEKIDKSSEFDEMKIIVLFNENPKQSEVDEIKADGGKIKHQYQIINAISINASKKTIEKLSKKNFIKKIEPDYQVKLVLSESIPQINAEKVWVEDSTGIGIDIAIIDTGIHDEHPALSVEKEKDFTGEGTDDLNGHGTHVAGITTSNNELYRGVAYNADLFNVKALNKYGAGYGSDIIRAIEWSVNNGAEIISLSLGAEITPCDGTDAMSQAVDEAVAKGVNVVIAAGNAGPGIGTITSPGCSIKGITIGAVDKNNNIASFSSIGPTSDGRTKPDLVAPGVSIKSTSKDNSFISFSGTSMSTPHVSGAIALLLEKNSSLNPQEIKDILKSTAFNLGENENTQGAGLIDIYTAYSLLDFLNQTIPPELNETINETEEDLGEGCEWLPKGLREKETLPKSWQERCPEAESNSDSLFNRIRQRISLAFTFNDEEKLEKLNKYIDERVAEIYQASIENKTSNLQDLIEDYEKKTQEREEIKNKLIEKGEDILEIEQEIIETSLIHTEILEELNKDNNEINSEIEKAITLSQKTNYNALKNLEQTNPEKATEIKLEVAKENLENIKEEIKNPNKQIKEYTSNSKEQVESDSEFNSNPNSQTESSNLESSAHSSNPNSQTTSSNLASNSNSGNSNSGSSNSDGNRRGITGRVIGSFFGYF